MSFSAYLKINSLNVKEKECFEQNCTEEIKHILGSISRFPGIFRISKQVKK
jgi:hypothetical protein